VNQALARMLWPAEEAVGRRLDLNSDPSAPYMCEVVGVVGDARDRALDAAPSPTVYFSCLQPTLGTGMAVILIRGRGDRQPPAERIRAAVKAADPSREILSMNSVSSGIDAAAKPADVRAKMLGAFAVLALLLGCVGLYATETYSVSQQMHEVGIRMALGATGNDVIAAILRRSALTAASGLAIGLSLALVVTRLTSGLLLFNVSPGDPLTYLSVAALLLLVALAAAIIPAWRAASVDPAVLLRNL
jgi:predicted lysophospholipase L1 biosynthesis ABC-type transport system permease subunit